MGPIDGIDRSIASVDGTNRSIDRIDVSIDESSMGRLHFLIGIKR